MMKLFVYVKDGPQKGNYGIVESYEGGNINIVKLYVNETSDYAHTMGFEQVKMIHCNVMGYFPVNDYQPFLNYICTLPTCEG